MKESLSIIIIRAPLSGRALGCSGAGGNQMVRGFESPRGTTDTPYICYFFAILTSFISITIDSISDDAEIIKSSLGSLSKIIAWIIGDGISARLEKAPIDAKADAFKPLSRDLAIRAAVETSASLIMAIQNR
jgi:hypothetical protein